MKQKIAILALLLAALAWAITSFSYYHFLSIGFSFVIIILVVRIFKLSTVVFVAYYKKVKHVELKDFKELGFLVLNALFSIGTPVFFLIALTQTSFSNVYFLLYTMPAWVFVLAAIFLGEKINPKKLLALLMAITGVIFIAKPESIFSLNTGVLYGFLAALSYSGDIITSRELKDYAYHTVAIYTNLFQVIVFALIASAFFSPSLQAVEGNIFLSLAAMAVVGILYGISSDLYFFSLEHLEASKAAMISLSELLFATALAFFLLGEVPIPFELIGYALIVVSAVLLILRKADIEHFEHLLHHVKKH